ncbi:hypothetical protein C2857_003964 [Epichloe festucae Fl1]|uniref:Uncharacterized protein n=1 Tax=Epichloe festucae (strain Fl1) TaxID=877507 RepID=A0A7U3Q260_EPIFF|nr:hypothetical protein C2857_003964 [Epichloe festucae Fl1]
MAARGVHPVEIPSFVREKEAISVIQNDALNGERFIVQSPYVDTDHLLDLQTLDNENALLARALSRLRAVREEYATASYTESFNWPEVIHELRQLVAKSGKDFKETSFYIVAFRSQIKPSTDYSHLGELDKAAHAEAIASGGFLKYWFGSPDDELRNLATCVWRSRQDALEGGRGPSHRKAAGATRSLYAYWKIDQHRLAVRDNVNSWEITEWDKM